MTARFWIVREGIVKIDPGERPNEFGPLAGCLQIASGSGLLCPRPGSSGHRFPQT